MRPFLLSIEVYLIYLHFQPFSFLALCGLSEDTLIGCLAAHRTELACSLCASKKHLPGNVNNVPGLFFCLGVETTSNPSFRKEGREAKLGSLLFPSLQRKSPLSLRELIEAKQENNRRRRMAIQRLLCARRICRNAMRR